MSENKRGAGTCADAVSQCPPKYWSKEVGGVAAPVSEEEGEGRDLGCPSTRVGRIVERAEEKLRVSAEEGVREMGRRAGGCRGR